MVQRKTTEVRKEEIKRAVLKIIKESGIKAVSTKNLAAEINLSEGSIFRHFKRKNDIIHSIIQDVSIDLISTLKYIVESNYTPIQKLEQFLCKTIEYLMSNNGITILLFSEATYNNNKIMLKKLRYIFNSQRLYLEQIIKEGIEQGVWQSNTDIEEVSLLYMGIPVTLNISLTLKLYKFDKKNFCQNTIEDLNKILK